MEEDPDALPLVDDGTGNGERSRRPWVSARALPVAVIIVALLFVGGVLGLYYQGPALRAFYRLTGLEPGGGAQNPIAGPVEARPTDDGKAPAGVVALGRLRPRNGTITVHAPYGAADARIASLLVDEGDTVETGEVIAVLDNAETLQSAVVTAKASVAVHEAALQQTRELVSSTQAELEASLGRARAATKNARAELKRSKELIGKGVIGQSELERAQTTFDEARAEVQRISAALSRYRTDPNAGQVDVALAQTNLDAAEAELQRAQRELRRSRVVAPQDGTILDVHARPGESPGMSGVALLGDLTLMTAELEVYQSDIGRIREGQAVRLTADPLGPEPLQARVTQIGLKVGRQTITRDNPAANADARVVSVLVTLDEPSTQRAQRLTGLELLARFEPDEEAS